MSNTTLSTTPVDKISAFYCLLFPSFAYYLQTLSVSIGRRPSVRSGASASSSDLKDLVDIDLGPLSQVSRLHARIDYDEDQELFVLAILGRNGAWVDGVWYASGRKVPLGSRTQITIANQTFHFLLPSAPDTDDSQSISSRRSSRGRSPSVDIMSMSPTTAPRSITGEPTDDEQDVESVEEIKPRVGKKRKKVTSSPKRPKDKPEVKKVPPGEMPPKPTITYANLSYRAIKAQGGRAALQDICRWIASNFEWYRLNEGTGWESSVRHTLSSNKAFTKVKRKDRGKGYLWTVNKQFASSFENQDVAAPSAHVRDAKLSNNKREPASSSTNKTTKGDPENPPGCTKGSLPTPATTPSRATPVPIPAPESTSSADTAQQVKAPSHSESAKTSSTTPASAAEIAASLVIPIVVKELPPEHPALLAAPPITGLPATILKCQPIIHDRTANILVVSPIVFGSLSQDEIVVLQNLGARKALDALRERYTCFLKERFGSSNSKKKKNKHKMKPQDSDGSIANNTKQELTNATTGTSAGDPDEPATKRRRLDTSAAS